MGILDMVEKLNHGRASRFGVAAPMVWGGSVLRFLVAASYGIQVGSICRVYD